MLDLTATSTPPLLETLDPMSRPWDQASIHTLENSKLTKDEKSSNDQVKIQGNDACFIRHQRDFASWMNLWKLDCLLLNIIILRFFADFAREWESNDPTKQENDPALSEDYSSQAHCWNILITRQT